MRTRFWRVLVLLQENRARTLGIGDFGYHMKILIVSGFLGAGKTTFIKALAKHTKKDFAILENEYGAAGIDADRLRAEEGQSPVNIWEMTEGCICCSAKGDFSLSVLSIANTIDPEYLQLPALFKRISCTLREPDQRCRNYIPVKVRPGFC